jgi:hypothetical protein
MSGFMRSRLSFTFAFTERLFSTIMTTHFLPVAGLRGVKVVNPDTRNSAVV